MIGFVESRLTTLAQSLESEMKVYNQVLLDPHGPYHSDLSSAILVTLPIQRGDLPLFKDSITRAFGLFDWRLQSSGDISDWKSVHESRYSIVTFKELPLRILSQFSSVFNSNSTCLKAYSQLPPGLSLYE